MPTLTSLDKTSGESKSSTLTVGDAFALPTMVGVGIAWQHGSKLTLGLDYSLQQWGKIDMPEMAGNENAFMKKLSFHALFAIVLNYLFAE